jgi:predicted chitinase
MCIANSVGEGGANNRAESKVVQAFLNENLGRLIPCAPLSSSTGWLATNPNLAVDVSCWFWVSRGLNARADADDLNGITRRINGGLNGLADRPAHLQRARCLLVP